MQYVLILTNYPPLASLHLAKSIARSFLFRSRRFFYVAATSHLLKPWSPTGGRERILVVRRVFTFMEKILVVVHGIQNLEFNDPWNPKGWRRCKFTPSRIERRGSSKYYLATWFRNELSDSFDSLAHPRNVSTLSLIYRYYRGMCSINTSSQSLLFS